LSFHFRNHSQGKGAQGAIIKAGVAAHLKTLVGREREIVMDLVMGDSMTAMLVVKEILSVEATTASSLASSTTRKMIAARSLQTPRPRSLPLPRWFSREVICHLLQARGAQDGTIRAEDAAPQIILVTRVKVTVMVLEMEELMMDMLGARETLCVAVITAGSLEHTTMTKTTAVRNQKHQKAGDRGSRGANVLRVVG